MADRSKSPARQARARRQPRTGGKFAKGALQPDKGPPPAPPAPAPTTGKVKYPPPGDPPAPQKPARKPASRRKPTTVTPPANGDPPAADPPPAPPRTAETRKRGGFWDGFFNPFGGG